MSGRRVVTIWLILLSSLSMTGCGSSYPGDGVVENKFRASEKDWARLVTMFREDRLSSLTRKSAYTLQRARAELPDARVAEYQKLFASLGVLEASAGERPPSVGLKIWHQDGFVVGGSYKFLVYTESPPSPLVDSLDELKNSGHDAFAYKQISGNWYQCLDIW